MNNHILDMYLVTRDIDICCKAQKEKRIRDEINLFFFFFFFEINKFIFAQMISLLGVAKPILENVIFCHQEESNWFVLNSRDTSS